MAIDPNKKFLYFNKDSTSGEMDDALCFPISSFIGAETQSASFMDLYFKGSKGTDATQVRVTIDTGFINIKNFYKKLVDQINFGEIAFIKVNDYAERSTHQSDVTFAMEAVVQPTFTLQDTDFIVAGDNLTFDNVQLTGIQTSAESFADNDVSLMTSAAIADTCLAFDSFGDASKNAAHNITFSSTQSGKPIFTLANFHADAEAPQFKFLKYDSGADGDDLGKINFRGEDDGGNQLDYAHILAEIADATDGEEAGRLSLKVAEFDGTLTTGLLIDGDTNANGEVDVTIGAGAASDTTIAGNLAVTTAFTLGGHAVNDIDLAGEFVDSDEHLMTSAAIDDRINTAVAGAASGDITGVDITVGTGLDISQSNTTSGDYSATINLDLTEVGVSGSANQLLTDDGDGTVTSHSNLTYDGTNLEITASGLGAPDIILTSTADFSSGSNLIFHKDRASTVQSNGDVLGIVSFEGEDSGGNSQTYARILGSVEASQSGQEGGQLKLDVATHNGLTATGIDIVEGDVSGEVDVTIGGGSSSVVTVPGFISIGGHTINDIDVAGEFVDSDEHLMTAAAIDDRIAAAGGGVSVADSNTDTAFPVVFHDESNNLLDDTGGFTYNPNSGNLAVPGNITAKTFQSLACSFFDDLGTTKHYIPISTQSTSEQASDGNTFTDFLAPCTIRVHEVMLKLPGTTTGSGDITIGIETSNIGSSVFTKSVVETETVSVTSSNDNDIVHFMFDNSSHATRGQNLSISIQNSADLSGSQNWYVNAIVEFDWSTRYSGSSALQTS
jgi:hypothetical protein